MIPTVDKATIYNTAGALARELDRQLLKIQQFKLWLDTLSDATLVNTYGCVQADVDTLRSAISDLDQLRALYQGSGTLGVAKDFRTFGKQTYSLGSLI